MLVDRNLAHSYPYWPLRLRLASGRRRRWCPRRRLPRSPYGPHAWCGPSRPPLPPHAPRQSRRWGACHTRLPSSPTRSLPPSHARPLSVSGHRAPYWSHVAVLASALVPVPRVSASEHSVSPVPARGTGRYGRVWPGHTASSVQGGCHGTGARPRGASRPGVKPWHTVSSRQLEQSSSLAQTLGHHTRCPCGAGCSVGR
jgi:hypothetical protein